MIPHRWYHCFCSFHALMAPCIDKIVDPKINIFSINIKTKYLSSNRSVYPGAAYFIYSFKTSRNKPIHELCNFNITLSSTAQKWYEWNHNKCPFMTQYIPWLTLFIITVHFTIRLSTQNCNKNCTKLLYFCWWWMIMVVWLNWMNFSNRRLLRLLDMNFVNPLKTFGEKLN